MEFDARGKPKSLYRFSDKKELLNTANPGKGFCFHGVNFWGGAPSNKVYELTNMVYKDNLLIVRSEKGFEKLTFDVNVHDSYLSFSLSRVENVPAENMWYLRFNINVVENIALHPLDHMTYLRNCYGATDKNVYNEDHKHSSAERNVYWNYFWDRNPDNPFGAFALHCPKNNIEHDENLLHVWVNEDALPKPAIQDAWTVERARKWMDGWKEFSSSVRSVTVHGKNVDDLKDMAEIALRQNLNQIKFHTHTWREEYWPERRRHLTPNPKIFPGGQEEFTDFCNFLEERGMRLRLHTLSGAIATNDPWVKGPNGPHPQLAHWLEAELVESVSEDDKVLYIRPKKGSSLPIQHNMATAGPMSKGLGFNLKTINIGGKEFCLVDEFLDTDKDVWKLTLERRGSLKDKIVAHQKGAKVIAYCRPYGMCFTVDNNSELLREMTKEFADFMNKNGVDHIDLDGLEIHEQETYGEAKFGRLLYSYLDHYAIVGTSTGGPMPFHMEYWFVNARKGSRMPTHMPLSLERTGRRSTGPYEVHVEVARLLAEQKYDISGLKKPEPMFDITKEMITSHGLSDRFTEQIRLWDKVSKNLTDEQCKVIENNYRSWGSKKFGWRTHYHQTDVLFEPRIINEKLSLLPLSLLKRPDIDSGWGPGAEFGPICVWQFIKVNEKVIVQNRYDAQEPEFVIHVMPALVNKRSTSESNLTSKATDEILEGYERGAGLEKGLMVEGAAKDLALQPKINQIKNLGDHKFEETEQGLSITLDNNMDKPYTNRKSIPHWDVKANSNRARGIGLTVTGDGSGAVLLIQIKGHGQADYVVPLDFTGTRDIVIPNGTVSYTNKNWFWSLEVKHMRHKQPIASVGLAIGHAPAKTKATATVSNLRFLAEEPASLINPTLKIGEGSLQINGTIKSDHYIWYKRGSKVGVYDINWHEVAKLPVAKSNFIAPGKGKGITYQIESEGKNPFPQLGVQIFTADKPMTIRTE